ncbi:partial Ferric uptake regulation protein, partial [Geobacteraceae bacterium]
HLVCTECGAIIEFENESIEKLQNEVAAAHGFLIRYHKLELYGLCTKCHP